MQPDFPRAIAGGLTSTVVMTAMMYLVAPMMMGVRMDIAAVLGSMLGGSWVAGMAMHAMLGSVVFPPAYRSILYGWLPGSPVLRGTIWGALLWFMAQSIVMPMMGGGVFSSQMGGGMAAMGSVIGHLIYGSLLGGIAGGPVPRAAHA